MDYEKEYKKLKAGISKAYLYAQTDSTKAVLENILPELTENEDERTRRSLIDAIKIGYSNNGISSTKEAADRYIAWLEKQKEQKPIKVLYIPKFRTGDLVRSSKNPRLTYKILSVGSMNELGNPEYEVEIFTDWKPDEPRNLKHIEIEKMDSWGELVEQKPSEWSVKGRRGRIGSTPEHIRKKAENFLSKMEPPYDADDICSAYETGAMENANSSWSEEDEKMLRTIISDGSRGVELDSKQISWLKSLRPVSKESLQPHWKPSEEQMEWLKSAVRLSTNKPHIHGIIISLYEQLKKLM